MIIGFTVHSTILAVMIPISQYETFLLLIGAVFVPLFGVVLSDYYIIKHLRYDNNLMYGNGAVSVSFSAIIDIIAWSFGVLLYYLLSSLSPLYISQWPQIGTTIPSFIGSSLLYPGIMKMKSIVYMIKKLKNKIL